MLTIKHREDSGYETVTTAESTSFIPKTNDTRAELIAFGVPNPISDGCNRYCDGVVYVMNERGSTVATYSF